MRQLRSATDQCRAGIRLRLKAQPNRKPHPAQDAQGVLPQAALRVAHAPDDASRQVVQPAEQVEYAEMPCRVPLRRHGVDREVPPRQVVLNAVGKRHAVRVPPVGIACFGAAGGAFHRHPSACRGGNQHGHGAVRDAGGHCAQSGGGTQRDGAIRRTGHGEVPIVRGVSHQCVAHASADGVCADARLRENIQQVLHAGWAESVQCALSCAILHGFFLLPSSACFLPLTALL